MNALVAATVLLLVGLLSGTMIAILNIAFEPRHCGEDCANIAWVSLLTWISVCTLLFPSVGTMLWLRREHTWHRLLLVSLSLALLVLLPAGALYLYRASH